MKQLEHARKQAASGRTAHRFKNLELSEEVHAREETSGGTAFRNSSFVSDPSENDTWNGSKCCPAVATGSSADGQTDDAESIEGDEGRAGARHSVCPDKANAICSAAGIKSIDGAAVIEADSAAWEMIGAALRALEVVRQKGAEVVRQARHTSGASPVGARCLGLWSLSVWL